MWPQIPEHACVRLVEAEIDATHRHEVDVAEFAGVDELLDAHDGRAVEERMAGQKYEAAPLGTLR